MARFSVRTFGFPEICRDDRPCRLVLRKGLALLVYLAEEKGSVGRDVVATMLWPESSEEVVRARLRRLLHRLRLALGDDALTTDQSAVRWSSAIDLQVGFRSFEAATAASSNRRAASIWANSDGFSPGGCPQFDEWAFFRRESLRGRAIQALERVVRDRNAAGEYAAAAAHAGRLVELDPLSEGYARHLIRNLLLAGDRAAAEHHFKALTQRLRNELDVAPESETRALINAGSTVPVKDPPPTRYVSGGGVHLAFQTYGAGRIDVLLLPGFVSHVDGFGRSPGAGTSWPPSSRWAVGRLFDRRGIGLSDRAAFTPKRRGDRPGHRHRA